MGAESAAAPDRELANIEIPLLGIKQISRLARVTSRRTHSELH